MAKKKASDAASSQQSEVEKLVAGDIKEILTAAQAPVAITLLQQLLAAQVDASVSTQAAKAFTMIVAKAISGSSEFFVVNIDGREHLTDQPPLKLADTSFSTAPAPLQAASRPSNISLLSQQAVLDLPARVSMVMRRILSQNGGCMRRDFLVSHVVQNFPGEENAAAIICRHHSQNFPFQTNESTLMTCLIG
ncbi:hypothetical protein [Blastopirellula marina]|uniref:Uncharacterized protein n=1 Tax=Blastopirellula marina DSM 3645 TaxID=314230 RepID=A4A248_9BACT|nr:hypothetical protein [Blastopirellula marina]EAQ77151.1 hypothetical protein DSM3645_15145 [Blastopirellula marina DSM 3645]